MTIKKRARYKQLTIGLHRFEPGRVQCGQETPGRRAHSKLAKQNQPSAETIGQSSTHR